MQGSGGCINRSFAEPAAHALAEMRQQLQSRSDECCKLLEDIETVLQLLKETSIITRRLNSLPMERDRKPVFPIK